MRRRLQGCLQVSRIASPPKTERALFPGLSEERMRDSNPRPSALQGLAGVRTRSLGSLNPPVCSGFGSAERRQRTRANDECSHCESCHFLKR